MLELRPTCENCNKALPPNSAEARICSYECTFCVTCVETVLDERLPELRRRLRAAADQAGDRTGRATTSSARIPRARRLKHRPVDRRRARAFAAAIKRIPPRDR